MPNNYPDLNGHIYHVSGSPAIYWIDGGQARHIADHATYQGVFGSSPNNEPNDLLGDITVGPDVAPGTVLIRANNWSEIYLVDQGTKRFIPSEAIKSKYQLNGNVHSVPPSAVNSIPDGPAFS
jgi:hypothetical protein